MKGRDPFYQPKIDARLTIVVSGTLMEIIEDLLKFTFRPVERAKSSRMVLR